jgi:hypothetical protein
MTSSEECGKHSRSIFELVNGKPRIYIKTMASKLKIDSDTASKWMKEAYEEGCIYGPQIRKRSYANFKEYVYLFNCKNPRKLYLELIEDERIVYHAVMIEYPNLWVISKEEIDFGDDVEIVVKGWRSDFHVSVPPNHSWNTAIRKMKQQIEVDRKQN